MIHTIEGTEVSEVLEVSTPHLHDVVRLLDDYGRTDPVSARRLEREGAGNMRLLDREQVARRLSISRTELHGFLSRWDFPQPKAYFRGRTLWDEADVGAFEAGDRPDGLRV
jgi:predicted DNA-binding transcriptional regulator AlpA